MKTIPREEVDALWDRFDCLDESQSKALARRMKKEQPFLLVYLMATEDAGGEGHEPGWLLELGGVVWVVLSGFGERRLRQVTGDELEAAEEANTSHLEKLDAGSEMDWMDGAMDLVKNYNQAPLLGAIIETLMAGNEETPELVGEEMGIGFLHLKTVIDCLDQ